MIEEMVVLDIMGLPPRRNFIGNKWVFKVKFNIKDKVDKYKAQLVAKGYFHVEGINFGDIFSLVSKLTSIILFLSVVSTFDFEVE